MDNGVAVDFVPAVIADIGREGRRVLLRRAVPQPVTRETATPGGDDVRTDTAGRGVDDFTERGLAGRIVLGSAAPADELQQAPPAYQHSTGQRAARRRYDLTAA